MNKKLRKEEAVRALYVIFIVLINAQFEVPQPLKMASLVVGR